VIAFAASARRPSNALYNPEGVGFEQNVHLLGECSRAPNEIKISFGV